MEEIKKMLRAVINGQSALKSKLITKINNLENKVDKIDRKIDVVDEKLSKRLDSIGKSVAYLEDDTPTAKDFDELTSRVSTLERKFSTL